MTGVQTCALPICVKLVGHKFYPDENNESWSTAERDRGVVISADDMQYRLKDIKDGCYCPPLADLIEACGDRFARLYIEKTIWTAESKLPGIFAIAGSPEEAVARLWLALQKQTSGQLLCDDVSPPGDNHLQ